MNMQLPDWLYESLPLIYVVTGWACLFAIGDSVSGLLSAILLFAVALRVSTWRRAARNHFHGRSGFSLAAG